MVLALCRSVASTAGQRSNLDIFVIHSQRLPRRVCRGRWGRSSATSRSSLRLPSRLIGRSSSVSIRPIRPTRACIPGEWRTGSSGRRCTSTALGFQAVAIARENRALQRADTVRLHWVNTARPRARTVDPSLEREYRWIKRAVPTRDTPLFNSYGGVTAALKRAVEGQPAVEGCSFQVVIDGDRTCRSQRLMKARFGSASRGSRRRSGM